MLKILYRIVAWFCIVAHLNLIMLPPHQASAMDCDRDASTESSHHPVSEQHFFANEEEQDSLTAGCIRDIKEPSEEGSSFWTYANKVKSTATNARKWLTGAIENNLTECISLAGCAVTSYLGIEPAESFFYWGAFVVSNHIMDQLRLSREPYQKTLAAIKTVDPWIKSLAPFLLLSMVNATPLIINGGYERSLEWPRSDVSGPKRFYYGDAAPYPINLTGNQSVAVFLRLTDGIEAFYALHPGEYGYTHYQISGSELYFDSATNMLKVVTNQAVDFLSHLSFEPPADIKCKDDVFGRSCVGYPYTYPLGGTIEMVFQLTTNLTAHFNDPGMTLVKHRLHIPHDPTYTGLIWGPTALGVVIGGGAGGVCLYNYIRKQIKHNKQNAAWESIQSEESLDMHLFNRCNTIKKEHHSYAEVIKIQVDCLHQMLSIDSIDPLSSIDNEERRQDIVLQYIQKYKQYLNAGLFDLCNYIKKEQINYNEALEIQVDCLHQVLINDSQGKDVLLQKFSQTEDTARRQGIAWQYIQKHKEEMKKKEPRVLFALSRFIEDRTEYDIKQENALDTPVVELTEVVVQESEEITIPEEVKENRAKDEDSLASHIEPLKEILVQDLESKTPTAWWHQIQETNKNKAIIKTSPYKESLSIQAECLLKILDQEPGAATSSNLCLTLINNELAGMEPNRRQDLILHLIVQSDLHSDTNIKLCDQIQKSHPNYKRAMIQKAHLIMGENERLSDERFKQAMLVLLECPTDKDAKAFRDIFRENYWTYEVGEDLPKVLKEPQNNEELDDFMSFAKERKKEKQKQSATTSL